MPLSLGESADACQTWEISTSSGCRGVTSRQHQRSANLPTASASSENSLSVLERDLVPVSLSLCPLLYSWPPCSPFHLPSTSPSRPSSLHLLGALTLSSIFHHPSLGVQSSVLCVGFVQTGAGQMSRQTECVGVAHASGTFPGQKHHLSLQKSSLHLLCYSPHQNITQLSSATWSLTENPFNYVSAFLSLRPLSDSPFLFHLFMETF